MTLTPIVVISSQRVELLFNDLQSITTNGFDLVSLPLPADNLAVDAESGRPHPSDKLQTLFPSDLFALSGGPPIDSVSQTNQGNSQSYKDILNFLAHSSYFSQQ
jgi:hypothetical protein